MTKWRLVLLQRLLLMVVCDRGPLLGRTGGERVTGSFGLPRPRHGTIAASWVRPGPGQDRPQAALEGIARNPGASAGSIFTPRLLSLAFVGNAGAFTFLVI